MVNRIQEQGVLKDNCDSIAIESHHNQMYCVTISASYRLHGRCCCKSSARCSKLFPKFPLLSLRFVILFCSTGGAGIIAAGRRGRAHPPLTWTQQHRCLKTRWTTKRVVAYLNKKREHDFHVLGGCSGLQYSDSTWMSEMLAVVHLMYVLVWILSGHCFQYQT